MIKLTLQNGDTRHFNFGDFDNERKFRNIWYSMHGDEKYDAKKMKITTSEGSIIKIPLNDIKSCEVVESVYATEES